MGGVAFPTLKRWANELCAYGAGCCESEGFCSVGCWRDGGLVRAREVRPSGAKALLQSLGLFMYGLKPEPFKAEGLALHLKPVSFTVLLWASGPECIPQGLKRH